MDEVTKMRQQREEGTAGVGADGVRRYIQVVEGRPYITTASHDEHGRANPPLTADAIRRHLPETAEALHAQGAERARAKGAAGRQPNADEVQAAAAGERERIAAILALPHAQGRERLAEQLALTEGMDVARASEILQAAPAERPSADGVLAPDPDVEARDEAGRAIEAARRSGHIR